MSGARPCKLQDNIHGHQPSAHHTFRSSSDKFPSRHAPAYGRGASACTNSRPQLLDADSIAHPRLLYPLKQHLSSSYDLAMALTPSHARAALQAGAANVLQTGHNTLSSAAGEPCTQNTAVTLPVLALHTSLPSKQRFHVSQPCALWPNDAPCTLVPQQSSGAWLDGRAASQAAGADALQVRAADVAKSCTLMPATRAQPLFKSPHRLRTICSGHAATHHLPIPALRTFILFTLFLST